MHPPEYYPNLRKPWEPESPRLIVIAESPPKSGKYFYDTNGKPTEPLFTALMESLVRLPKPPTKAIGLEAFKQAGYLLLDATYTAVDGISEGRKRDNVLVDDYPVLRRYLEEANPRKDIPLLLVKANVCRLLTPLLLADGYPVLNGDRVVPFPSHGNQGRFREVVLQLLLEELR